MIWYLFRGLGRNPGKNFVDILVQTMKPKGHFEINWPSTNFHASAIGWKISWWSQYMLHHRMILLRYHKRKIDGLGFRVRINSVEKLERSPGFRMKCDKELQICTAAKFSKIVLRGRSQKCRPYMLKEIYWPLGQKS